MRVKYFADTDTMHLELSESSPTESREISENLIVDYDDAGKIVGLTIEHARNEALAPDFSYQMITCRESAEQKAGFDTCPSPRKSA